MKNIQYFAFLLSLSQALVATGSITNNGHQPINVVFYNNYQAASATTSAKGRLNPQGLIIPGGQNSNIPNNATSVDIYYSDQAPGIHGPITPNSSYTVTPASPTWILTQDQ